MKKMFLLFVAAMAISANGSTFRTSDLFSISLPDGWGQVPKNVLEAFAAKNDELSPDSPSQTYDYGYQPITPDGQWLSYPYVLIQVRPVGRIPSSELVRYQKMSTEMEAFALPDVSFGETIYDKANQILWSTLATHTREGESVKALVAVKLTETGYIRLMGCSTEESFEENAKIFKTAFLTLGLDESIAYKPQIADAVPSVGGIKTGKVLVWIIQAAVIGGVLWVLYIALKRRLKRAD